VSFAFSLEAVQSNVVAHGQLDLGGPTSTAIITTDFTATHADITSHIDTSCSNSRTTRLVQTPSLIVMPNTAAPLPYHAVAASVLPATATSPLVGYVDLSAHQTSSCVSPPPPPPVLASQNCLTTKIRAGRNFPLLSSKFTPY